MKNVTNFRQCFHVLYLVKFGSGKKLGKHVFHDIFMRQFLKWNRSTWSWNEISAKIDSRQKKKKNLLSVGSYNFWYSKRSQLCKIGQDTKETWTMFERCFQVLCFVALLPFSVTQEVIRNESIIHELSSVKRSDFHYLILASNILRPNTIYKVRSLHFFILKPKFWPFVNGQINRQSFSYLSFFDR